MARAQDDRMTGPPTPKKKKRKKQGSAAVLEHRAKKAKLKGVGDVNLGKSISLAEAASGKPGAITVNINRKSDQFSPSERAAARTKERGPQFAKGLATLAASVGPGRSKIGAAVSGGLTGAALGALIDEGRAKRKADAEKKKKKDG